MAKLGDYPSIMTIHDIGDEKGQLFIVIPVMSGGDVEGFIEKAPENRLPVEQVISIVKAVRFIERTSSTSGTLQYYA